MCCCFSTCTNTFALSYQVWQKASWFNTPVIVLYVDSILKTSHLKWIWYADMAKQMREINLIKYGYTLRKAVMYNAL